MWRSVDVGLTDVSGERIASIFKAEKIREQSAATCSRWFTLADFFHLEDGGDTFLRNVG
jgi:hypothetical protein